MKTQKMIEKVAKIIDRNQKAMQSAAAKGDEAVVKMCAEYHWRLRKIENYLEDRYYR